MVIPFKLSFPRKRESMVGFLDLTTTRRGRCCYCHSTHRYTSTHIHTCVHTRTPAHTLAIVAAAHACSPPSPELSFHQPSSPPPPHLTSLFISLLLIKGDRVLGSWAFSGLDESPPPPTSVQLRRKPTKTKLFLGGVGVGGAREKG